MAKQGGEGEKTHSPTHQRLRDARKKGETSRSKELTGAFVLAAWLCAGAVLAPWIVRRLGRLVEIALDEARKPSLQAFEAVGAACAATLVMVVAALALPVAAVGLAAAFVQVGPILTTEKLRFQLDRLNPVEGMNRIFGTDALVEAAKSVVKAAAMLVVLGVLLQVEMSRVGDLASGGPQAMLQALGRILLDLLLAAVVVSIFVAIPDAVYQRFAFLKRLRMSTSEVRRERKDHEGDPRMKRRRQRLHRAWAERGPAEAARDATAVVVNPTHLAVALTYEPEVHAAPIVSAMGYGFVAEQIRRSAEEAGVPVIQNVALARALFERTDIDETVPSDLFTAVAEVIIWAQRLRAEAEAAARRNADDPTAAPDVS